MLSGFKRIQGTQSVGGVIDQSFVSDFLPVWAFMDLNAGLRFFITDATASGISWVREEVCRSIVCGRGWLTIVCNIPAFQATVYSRLSETLGFGQFTPMETYTRHLRVIPRM